MNTKALQKFKDTEIGRIPEDWDVSTLGDIAIKVTDGSHFSPKENKNGEYIIATVKDMRYNQFSYDECKKISEEEFNSLVNNGCSPEKGDILISKDGAKCLELIFVYKDDQQIVLLSSIAIVRLKNDYFPEFYRYYLLSPSTQKIMREGYVTGSAIPRVILRNFKHVPVPLPTSLSEQQAIAKILTDLDTKIELNQKMNKTLEAIAQAIFKRWFVDFEFPDENGNPYKSSGGEMVESELGEIPKGWGIKKLGDIVINYDSKRIPLSSRERAKRQGIYPYYGAAGILDYVDDYLFDGIYLLIGEDGTVADEEGFPILQYVWGQFWVNNHAHILQAQVNIPLEFIYLYLKRTNITSIITGAVQPKINQRNLNSLEIVLPDNDVLKSFSSVIQKIFERTRKNTDAIKSLSTTRDSLLPRLMSGKIRVKVSA